MNGSALYYEIDWRSRIIDVAESYVVSDKPTGGDTSVIQYVINSAVRTQIYITPRICNMCPI